MCMVKPEIVFLTIGNHSEQEGVMLSPDDGTLLKIGGNALALPIADIFTPWIYPAFA